jgi:hypothetical protein
MSVSIGFDTLDLLNNACKTCMQFFGFFKYFVYFFFTFCPTNMETSRDNLQKFKGDLMLLTRLFLTLPR